MKAFYESKHFFSDSEKPVDEVAQLVESVPYSTVGVFVDGNVPHQDVVRELFPNAVFVERIEGGDSCKTLPALTRFVDAHQCVLDRNSLIVVIGGGAVLDLVGLWCGLMYRGIRYVSVPTTLIAMADAAYGGKVAVNHCAKNQIGMYHHPHMVYVNPTYLRSLPTEHVASGMIEIAKLAFFFEDIRRALDVLHLDGAKLSDAILIAARCKLELMKNDPFEDNAASVLLYGHPFANAFETFAVQRQGNHVPHGFAVALGISLSAWLSERLFHKTGSHAEAAEFLSRWIDLVALARKMTPANAEEVVPLLTRDKYVNGDLIKLPAMKGQSGYTTIPLKQLAAEYNAWRSSLVAETKNAVQTSCDSATRGQMKSAYIAGHPTDETVSPLCFASADGPFLITADGRRVLDWSTCLNAPFGHSRRLDTSMLPVNSGNYATEPRDKLVNRLRRLFPFISGFQFRSSGTESVEGGLRYVRAALGSSTQTVSIQGCYHGLTLGAMTLMGYGKAGFEHTVLPLALLQDVQNAIRKLESLVQSGPVAVWIESVQGATLRQLPLAFLGALKDLRKQHPRSIALVCDDMLASIRCGDWCSIANVVEPDVFIAGKCWANGYPFSFFGVAPWLRDAAGDILGTTSFGGNPIACAHAVYTIDRIQETGLLEQVRRRASLYAPRLATAVGAKASVVRSEWHGMLFGFEMVNITTALHTAGVAASSGLLVSQLGSVIRCSPQLDLSDELLDRGMNILVKAIDANE